MNVNLKVIFRDFVAILLLTFLGGYLVGQMNFDNPFKAMQVSNVVAATFGFFVSGCLSPQERFKHLLFVTILVWLSGLVNVALYSVSLVVWLKGIIILAGCVAIGGGLSKLVVKG